MFFLILNLLVAAAGAGVEYWRSQPKALPAFNADKIKLRGVGDADLGNRKADKQAANTSTPDDLPADP